MAANTIDKLLFLSFVFAVLLLITVHFIALRPGRKVMHQHTKILLKVSNDFRDIIFFILSRWQLATMLNF